MEAETPRFQLGRVRPRRPARADELCDARKGAAGHRGGEGGDQLRAFAAARLSRRRHPESAPRPAAPRAPPRHPPPAPPRPAATIRDGKSAGKQNFCFPLADDEPELTDVVSDDRVLLTLQYSTQWDSFAHMGSRFDADGDGKREIVFYNGFRAGEDLVPASERSDSEPWARYEGTKAKALGIENLAEHGAQGRGVMIDLHHRYGRERRAVGCDELMKLMDKDRVQVEKGDMVCIYTGFADLLLEMRKHPDAKLLHASCSGLDGRDERLLQWISDSGLAVLASDNYAVEIIPVSLS